MFNTMRMVILSILFLLLVCQVLCVPMGRDNVGLSVRIRSYPRRHQNENIHLAKKFLERRARNSKKHHLTASPISGLVDLLKSSNPYATYSSY